MDLQKLEQQNKAISDFAEGYRAALNWFADEMLKEQKAREAANASKTDAPSTPEA